MSAKHTPWRVVPSDYSGDYDVIGVASNGDPLTFIAEDIEDLDHAHLIAAAPQVYEALTDILETTGGCLGCGNCMMCSAADALRAARGEVTSDGE